MAANNTPDNLIDHSKDNVVSAWSEEGEISILDFVIVLLKYKVLVLGLPFVIAALAVGYSLLLDPVYTATTKLLPPQQSQSATSAILAQLGGIASFVGGAAGLRGANDLYIAMLKSRTVADNMIQRFDLMKLYDLQYRSQAYKRLENVTAITSGKDNVITLEVDDRDPKRAADIANAYVDELLKFTSVIAVTEASQRRLFFERHFLQAKDNLAKAEIVAREALQTSGLIKVDDQGRAIVETTARLRAQITAKVVQLGAMRTFAADQNPDLRRAQEELESMRRELAKQEGSDGTKVGALGRGTQGGESLGLLRDVKYNEVLTELLAKQFELAKIDEAKDASIIQVMDKAVVPDRKSKPNRTLIVLLSTLAGMMVSILLALLKEAISRAQSDPKQANRMQSIKRHFAWRS